MKHILLLLIAACVLFSCGSGSSTNTQAATVIKQSTDVTEVLYFHGKKRCITCNAIEHLTKEVVDSLNNHKIILKIIDISQPENEAIANQYEVTWSSLILSRNGTTENLTDMGFSYAKNKPAEFKEKLVEAIEKIAE
ncbi:MAG: nitrophenyl compound nitroreductase subunit ArsF family protein [Bacteroidales bacterium]